MKVPNTKLVEREGVAKAEIAFGKLGYAFREQTTNDYGIDAHVEMLKDGTATGRLIALQIKSGVSQFSEKSENSIIFRSDVSHLDYWLNHSLPVLIVLYNPDSERMYWQLVSDDNAIMTGKNWKIEIPIEQIVDSKFKSIFEKIAINPVEIINQNGQHTILSLKDSSHGAAKRYAADILVPESLSHAQIQTVIRNVSLDLKHREYYRSKETEKVWQGKPAQVVFLFIYNSLDDVRNTNWICHALWIDENLPSQFAPHRLKGEDIGDNIVVDWSNNYEILRQMQDEHTLSKETFLSELENVTSQLDKIVKQAIQLTHNYESGGISSETYITEMKILEPKIVGLYERGGRIGFAPFECKDLRQRFLSLISYAYNIVLPFSKSGLAKWPEKNRMYLVNKAIQHYQKDKTRLEFELEKVN